MNKLIRRSFSLLKFQDIYPLSNEQQQLQSFFRDFAHTNIEPIASKTDLENTFPKELFPVMGQYGLLGLTCPEKYGGLDQGYLAQALAMEEISRCSASIGLSYAVQANLCINQLVRFANEKQAEKYLPELC